MSTNGNSGVLVPHTAPSTPSRIGQATAVEQSRAVAEVEAAIVVAMRHPRNVPAAIEAMRESCSQPALAERAFFRFPRGGQTVSGPSVHLARELARVWGNFQYGIAELRRDDEYGQSEMIAFAWDVQTNTRNSSAFIQPHMRDKRDGPERLTDMRDIYESNANAGARRVREAIFASLPTWFVEEAKDLCDNTLKNGGGKPLAQRVADAISAFGSIGVSQAGLEAKTGQPSSKWTEHDVAQLGVIYKSIQRGEISKDEEFPAGSERTTVADLIGTSPQAAAVSPPAAGAPPPAPEPQGERPETPVELSNEPGSVTTEQVNSLWQLATSRYEFTKDDKGHWWQACEHLIGRKLTGGTVGNLSAREAAHLLDDILPAIAKRDDLIVRLAAPPGETQ